MTTISENLFGNDNLNATLEQSLKVVDSFSQKITGIRPADPTRQKTYDETLAHLNTIRGRNLYYPYLSSGLGNGPYVELEDGSVKMDLINGIGINLFGHSHPELLKTALKASLQDVIMQGNLQPSREYAEFLDLVLKLAGRYSKLKRGWVGSCGTIVNENALKIARQKNSPARKILAMKHCFAGRSTLMAAITDNPEYRMGLPEYDEVLYLPFYDKDDPQSTANALELLRKYIRENPKDISCLMTELVQGEGGFNAGTHDYFKALFEECRKHHIAVWIDEIQTFARTGELFAFDTLCLGEYVDIVTFAKTAQCGGVLYTEEYNPKPGLIAGTFTSSTVALATGKRSLEMLTEGYNGVTYLGQGGRVAQIYKEFTSMIQELKESTCRGLITDVGGLGLMVSMTPFDGSKEKTMKLLQVLFQKGVIAFSCGHGPYKVRFLLPIVLEAKHIKEFKGVLEAALQEVARS